MYHIYECILYASCPGQLAFRAQHCIPRPLTVTHPRRLILLLRLGNARFSRERRRHLTGWSRNWMVSTGWSRKWMVSKVDGLKIGWSRTWMVSTGWSRLHCAIPVVHICRFLVYLGLSYLEFSQRCVVCCSVLQCVAVCCKGSTALPFPTFLWCIYLDRVVQCVAVCCSVFNCITFSALPVVHIFRSCGAVCCSILQCVQMCCLFHPPCGAYI